MKPFFHIESARERRRGAMPIDQAMLDEVKALMPTLRRIAGLMDPKEAESLLLGSQVKAEMEEATPC